jgi:transmembrane sensor
MPGKTSRIDIHPQVIDEASQWFVDFRLGDTDAQTRARFNAWLRASPTHIHAYLEIAGTYAALAPPGATLKLDIEHLIASARADQNVLDLPGMVRAGTPPAGHRGFPLAMAVTVMLALGGVWAWNQFFRGVYATEIGEQRSLILSDGSRIDLNARSRVRVRIDDSERRVELLRGQAMFRVAKDARRPFVVRADDTRIRVLGTTFDVNRGQRGTTVTVLEGKVMVVAPLYTREAKAAPTVAAGQQLTVADEPSANPALFRVKPVNVSAATAWTQRQLVFEGTPLVEVVEEFNRYNARQIHITDARLNDLRVSGIYASPDPESLLNFLRTEPDILVKESTAEVRIAHK